MRTLKFLWKLTAQGKTKLFDYFRCEQRIVAQNKKKSKLQNTKLSTDIMNNHKVLYIWVIL